MDKAAAFHTGKVLVAVVSLGSDFSPTEISD